MKMMTQMMMVGMMMLMAGVGGCSGTNRLDRRYVAVRPEYGDKALANSGGEVEAVGHVEMVNPDPTGMRVPEMREVVTGTWTFTTPPTTTRVERKNGGFSQFSLYNGRPVPTAVPIVVITVSPDARSQAEADPETYTVKNTRTYILNGNLAKEWTGTTKGGASFSELVISKLGSGASGEKGDVCHAVAVAKMEEERKVALAILGSITWKAAGE